MPGPEENEKGHKKQSGGGREDGLFYQVIFYFM